MSKHIVPGALSRELGSFADGVAWLERLPSLIDDAAERWGLRLEAPFPAGTAGWTAPARTRDGEDAVVKIVFPHEEAAAEPAGLRLWSGQGGPELFDHHSDSWTLLLRRARPGHGIEKEPELLERRPEERLALAGELLGRLQSVNVVTVGDVELPLQADYTARLANLLRERIEKHATSLDADRGLLVEAANLLEDLPASATPAVVHGDFNPGNLLADDVSGRRRWVAIDPKPMVGDPAYDPEPLLSQVADPFKEDNVTALLRSRTKVVCAAAGLDPARVAAWGVARMAESALWLADKHGNRNGALNQLNEAREWSRLMD